MKDHRVDGPGAGPRPCLAHIPVGLGARAGHRAERRRYASRRLRPVDKRVIDLLGQIADAAQIEGSRPQAHQVGETAREAARLLRRGSWRTPRSHDAGEVCTECRAWGQVAFRLVSLAGKDDSVSPHDRMAGRLKETSVAPSGGCTARRGGRFGKRTPLSAYYRAQLRRPIETTVPCTPLTGTANLQLRRDLPDRQTTVPDIRGVWIVDEVPPRHVATWRRLRPRGNEGVLPSAGHRQVLRQQRQLPRPRRQETWAGTPADPARDTAEEDGHAAPGRSRGRQPDELREACETLRTGTTLVLQLLLQRRLEGQLSGRLRAVGVRLSAQRPARAGQRSGYGAGPRIPRPGGPEGNPVRAYLSRLAARRVRVTGRPGDLCTQVGDRYVVLMRAHYFYRQIAGSSSFSAPARCAMCPTTRSSRTCCWLLTSSSRTTSVMFDYAVLDRLIVIHANDWDTYVRVRGGQLRPRGSTAGRRDDNAGTAGRDIGLRCRSLGAGGCAPPRLRDQFCQWEDGHAGERVVRAGPDGRRGHPGIGTSIALRDCAGFARWPSTRPHTGRGTGGVVADNWRATTPKNGWLSSRGSGAAARACSPPSSVSWVTTSLSPRSTLTPPIRRDSVNRVVVDFHRRQLRARRVSVWDSAGRVGHRPGGRRTQRRSTSSGRPGRSVRGSRQGCREGSTHRLVPAAVEAGGRRPRHPHGIRDAAPTPGRGCEQRDQVVRRLAEPRQPDHVLRSTSCSRPNARPAASRAPSSAMKSLSDWRAAIARVGPMLGDQHLVDIGGDAAAAIDAFIDPTLRRSQVSWADLGVPHQVEEMTEEVGPSRRARHT